MTAATLSQTSPFYQSSPCLLDQNQRVPGSPSLSPFYGRLAARRVLSSPSNSPAAQVPEAGERVFTGSPLLRQILRVGRKRQHEQEDSPSPSIASVSKRFCEASRVPTSVIVVRRKVEQKRTSQEQVVPGYNSPLCAEDSCRVDIQRKLPENSEGAKPLDLFTGDDIFACHEE